MRPRRRGGRAGAGRDGARHAGCGDRAAPVTSRPVRAGRGGAGAARRRARRAGARARRRVRRGHRRRHGGERGSVPPPPHRRGPSVAPVPPPRNAALDDRRRDRAGVRDARPAGDVLDGVLVECARDRGGGGRRALGPCGRGARRRHRCALPRHVRGVRRAAGARSAWMPAVRSRARRAVAGRGRRGARSRGCRAGPGARRARHRPRARSCEQQRRPPRDGARSRGTRRAGRPARRAGRGVALARRGRLRERARHRHAAERRDGGPGAARRVRAAPLPPAGQLHEVTARSLPGRGGRDRGRGDDPRARR